MAGKSVPMVKQKLDKKDLALSLAFLLPAILITVILSSTLFLIPWAYHSVNGMVCLARQSNG